MFKLTDVNQNPPTAYQLDFLGLPDPHNTLSSRVNLPGLLPDFTVDVRFRSLNCYIMIARDPSQYLSCELTLEIKKQGDRPEFEGVICHFPAMQDECLSAYVGKDLTLTALLLIQFHTRILERLLAFCAHHNLLELIIHTNISEVTKLRIYERFVVHVEQLHTHPSKIALTIPTDRATYNMLIDYMDHVNRDFRKTLWKEQSKNPAIHKYLKTHSVV